ncbi:phosphate ABC transporter substrate-binding protein PstS family protein [Parahalioglobus pacificus]
MCCLLSMKGRAEAPAQTLDYQPVVAVSGTLSSVGSDTMANLMTLWTENFKQLHPGTTIQVQTAGSGTAAPALTEGTATLGPMSRRMTRGEILAFERSYGYAPTAVPVAVDALAIFVHRDNPLSVIDIQMVDAIFSSTRACGANQTARVWGDVGLTGDWATRPIDLFGRTSASGTYGFFKRIALCGGDFSDRVNQQPGASSVVQALAVSPYGVGYSGAGFGTASVKTVPLVDRLAMTSPEPENALSNDQAQLSRQLYIYTNREPGEPLPPLEREFFRFVLSDEGQQVVARAGYVPVSVSHRRVLMEQLDLE